MPFISIYIISSLWRKWGICKSEKNKHNQATLESKLEKWLGKVTTSDDNVITPEEKKRIKDYLKGVSTKKKYKVKKKSLPPGLAKKLVRGETLLPGWQKKVA